MGKFIIIVLIVFVIVMVVKWLLGSNAKNGDIVYGRDIGKNNVYNNTFDTWNFKVSVGFVNAIKKMNNAGNDYTDRVFKATREIYGKINDEIFDKYKHPEYVPDSAKKIWFETKVDSSKFFGCENYLEVADLHTAACIRGMQICTDKGKTGAD